MHSPLSTFPVTGVLMALIVAGVLLINAPPGLAGTVNVSFIHPENFSDASLQSGYGTRAQQGTLDEIGRFFESLGPRYLKSGQVLTLDVLNVDLAGSDLLQDPRGGLPRSLVAYASARLGDTKRAEMEIVQALKFSPNDSKVLRFGALTYETLNQRDKALEVLSSASADLLSELNRQPDLAELRQDSRFVDLLRRKSTDRKE